MKTKGTSAQVHFLLEIQGILEPQPTYEMIRIAPIHYESPLYLGCWEHP